MNPRDIVLGAIRKNLPQPAVPLPEVQSFAHPGEPGVSPTKVRKVPQDSCQLPWSKGF